MPLIPLSASYDKHQEQTNVNTTGMFYVMNKLTDLIVYQESILTKPESTSCNNFIGESSKTISNADHVFDNEMYFRVCI